MFLVTALQTRSRALLPGVTVTLVVAAAAAFLAEQYHAPAMLFALLLGIAMNFVTAQSGCKDGIEFAGRDVLRVGVALLGTRITFRNPPDGNNLSPSIVVVRINGRATYEAMA